MTPGETARGDGPALAAGARVGPYEILAPLGAGGMGEVYRARDTRLPREVALKVLPVRFSADPARLARFSHEAHAIGALNHPNVVTLYDVGTHEGAPYVVSELLDGETLAKRLEGGPLPLQKVALLGIQAAHGLAAAHEKGIVHRDLKPQNVFLTNDGRLKILDFGLAKLTRPEAGVRPPGGDTASLETNPGEVLGTVGYMAPEQVRGEPADPRSDIFALGAILFEMLTGRRAFRGATAVDTMTAILHADPFDPASGIRMLPPALARVVRHCLEKGKEERFQSARDVAFDLETVATSASSGTLRPPRFRWPGVSGRRLSAALVLAVLAGAAVLALRRGGEAGAPSFLRLTFRRGFVPAARFMPDGQTIVYSAAWDGLPPDVFTARPPRPDTHALSLGRASLLAVHSSGDLGVALGYRLSDRYLAQGTLAQVAFAGGSPRELVEGVLWADWSPDGRTLAVARRVEGRVRLESPVGTTLYESAGLVSHLRFSPDGTRIAFLDHPVFNNDRGDVAVIDIAGKRTVLSSGWGMAGGLAWSGSGREVLFSAVKDGIVCDLWGVTLSGKLRRVVASAGGLTLLDVSKDGRALISRESRRRSMNGRRPGDERERDLSYLDWSYVADVSDDGERIVFTEEGDGAGGGPLACVRGFGETAAPVRLGTGYAQAISPDKKWVLAISTAEPEELVLLPVGAGTARPLPRGTVTHFLTGEFVADGKRIVFNGSEKDHVVRAWIQDLGGGPPRPITEEGVRKGLASPDGDSLLGVDGESRTWLYSLSGRPRSLVASLKPLDVPAGFSRDGRSLFVQRPGEDPPRVYAVDLATGARRVLRALAPVDPAGIITTSPVVVGLDGETYVYSPVRVLSELYLVSDLGL